jgi:hypothetical protein
MKLLISSLLCICVSISFALSRKMKTGCGPGRLTIEYKNNKNSFLSSLETGCGTVDIDKMAITVSSNAKNAKIPVLSYDNIQSFDYTQDGYSSTITINISDYDYVLLSQPNIQQTLKETFLSFAWRLINKLTEGINVFQYSSATKKDKIPQDEKLIKKGDKVLGQFQILAKQNNDPNGKLYSSCEDYFGITQTLLTDSTKDSIQEIVNDRNKKKGANEQISMDALKQQCSGLFDSMKKNYNIK